MKMNKQLAYMMKIANKEAAKRAAEMRKMQKAIAAKAKKNYGCCSDLPTDTNWDAVMADQRTNRFYTDKRTKGHNGSIQSLMCDA